jgi:hypothetical protein
MILDIEFLFDQLKAPLYNWNLVCVLEQAKSVYQSTCRALPLKQEKTTPMRQFEKVASPRPAPLFFFFFFFFLKA